MIYSLCERCHNYCIPNTELFDNNEWVCYPCYEKVMYSRNTSPDESPPSSAPPYTPHTKTSHSTGPDHPPIPDEDPSPPLPDCTSRNSQE